MSRPLVQLDWDKIDEMLMKGSPGTEIAAMYGIHPETFYKRVVKEKGVGFSEYYQQKRSIGNICLRRKQFEVALEGNTTMLVWLGKQLLGQREESKIDHSGNISTEVVHYGQTPAQKWTSEESVEEPKELD